MQSKVPAGFVLVGACVSRFMRFSVNRFDYLTRAVYLYDIQFMHAWRLRQVGVVGATMSVEAFGPQVRPPSLAPTFRTSGLNLTTTYPTGRYAGDSK